MPRNQNDLELQQQGDNRQRHVSPTVVSVLRLEIDAGMVSTGNVPVGLEALNGTVKHESGFKGLEITNIRPNLRSYAK